MRFSIQKSSFLASDPSEASNHSHLWVSTDLGVNYLTTHLISLSLWSSFLEKQSVLNWTLIDLIYMLMQNVNGINVSKPWKKLAKTTHMGAYDFADWMDMERNTLSSQLVVISDGGHVMFSVCKLRFWSITNIHIWRGWCCLFFNCVSWKFLGILIAEKFHVDFFSEFIN